MHLHVSNQATQRNHVMQLIRQPVYMHRSLDCVCLVLGHTDSAVRTGTEQSFHSQHELCSHDIQKNQLVGEI